MLKKTPSFQPFDPSSGLASRPPLMSLVDILFSAVGIFLIFISLNAVVRARVDRSPHQADAVIVCHPEDRFKLYTIEKPLGIELEKSRIQGDLKTLLSNLNRNMALMIAFGSESFPQVDHVEEQVAELNEPPNGKMENGRQKGIKVMYWPLSDKDSEVAPLMRDILKRAEQNRLEEQAYEHVHKRAHRGHQR
jgi:hypothetical protein